MSDQPLNAGTSASAFMNTATEQTPSPTAMIQAATTEQLKTALNMFAATKAQVAAGVVSVPESLLQELEARKVEAEEELKRRGET
ncbi:hypothetical protein Dda_2762 [Drechslerella dactyloides]|uniref:Uncharacterized protein n=1 Tax=Drechslerella dactyloides TaxID=74499 RepID=A0AAD6J067_DREDA|nr:hypothetical protein Dda_2762 [Drechslerella dactyloides]